MAIRVAIFEDNKLMRNGFGAICNGTEGLMCCGASADSFEIDFKIKEAAPQIILMDFEMPGTDGIAATRHIIKRWPEIKILI